MQELLCFQETFDVFILGVWGGKNIIFRTHSRGRQNFVLWGRVVVLTSLLAVVLHGGQL